MEMAEVFDRIEYDRANTLVARGTVHSPQISA